MSRDRLSKDAFLMQLEQLLYDIPKEEREEAVDYYRSYFEDAGAENEAAVLEELDSPQTIAAVLKEELNNSGNMTSLLKNPPQVRESQAQTSSEYESGRQEQAQGEGQDARNNAQGMFFDSDFQKSEAGTGSGYGSASSYDSGSGYGSASGYDSGSGCESSSRADSYSGTQSSSRTDSYSGTGSYRRYDQYGSQEGKGVHDKGAKLILFIILAVFTSPIWGGAASVLFGAVGIIIACVAALGGFAIGGTIGGVVCVITGIVRLCMLSMVEGLTILGVGMFLIAGSGISIILLLLLCGRLLPWVFRQTAQLFGRLWKWGRSMA